MEVSHASCVPCHSPNRKNTGIYNFCNPGAISHNEILEMYKKYIDPKFTYTNFSVEEQDKILVGRRSNNELSSDKLVEALGDDCKINEIHVSTYPLFECSSALLFV